jgi:hypothetical protein
MLKNVLFEMLRIKKFTNRFIFAKKPIGSGLAKRASKYQNLFHLSKQGRKEINQIRSPLKECFSRLDNQYGNQIVGQHEDMRYKNVHFQFIAALSLLDASIGLF